MLSKNVRVALLSAVLLFSVPALVAAAEWASDANTDGAAASGPEFWMNAGVEAWSGDITYSIGYPVTDLYGYTYNGYFPFSELTFPLDAAFASVEAGVVIIDKYALRLNVKKNVTDPSDDMEDRDWITDADPSRLDVYSDSEITDFTATVVDADVSYRIPINDRVMLAAGFGYMHQDFEYETAVNRQWSPSGLTGFDYVGDGGTSLIYEVDFEMPYLLFSGHFNITPSFTLNGRFAYAPWVDVDTTDQHLLRSMVNTSSLDGSAVMFTVDAEYDFTPQFFINGGLDYTYIEADGDMDEAFYGIHYYTVAEELDSRQTALFARVGFRFGVPGSM